jgi:hypothetical protein
LQTATRAYLRALLTGTASQVQSLRSANCPPISATTLRGIRADITGVVHMSPSRIDVTGVRISTFTGTTATASATFDLPESEVGNDNAITYTYEDGGWKVTDCSLLPLGGQSVSASSSASSSASASPMVSVMSRGSV